MTKEHNVMGYEATKLELIGWLTKLDDDETLDFLKIIKESQEDNQDWWFGLTNEQKQGIERGLRDISLGEATPHDDIAGKTFYND